NEIGTDRRIFVIGPDLFFTCSFGFAIEMNLSYVIVMIGVFFFSLRRSCCFVGLNNQDHFRSFNKLMLLLSIVFFAFNLRPAITSVGTVIVSIRDDVGLSNWSVGILTSLPLLAFAFMSPLVPKLGHRYTNERALVLGLVLLTIG